MHESTQLLHHVMEVASRAPAAHNHKVSVDFQQESSSQALSSQALALQLMEFTSALFTGSFLQQEQTSLCSYKECTSLLSSFQVSQTA